jgi:UrcA family protein
MFKSDRILVRSIVTTAATILAMAFIPELSQAASTTGDAKSVGVQYHASDLDTPEGVSILYRRIRGAATEVCSPFDSRGLDRRLLWNDCFSHAVANAVHAVHNEALSAYHWQRIRGWKQPQIEAPISLAEQRGAN